VEIVLVVVLVAAVAFAVLAPLFGGRATRSEEHETAEHAEWSAARDAKYAEIREAELDYRAGKLSRTDWTAQDRALRAEAIAILRRLDALEGREDEPDRPLS
jgi:hypothetical protein